MWIDCFKCTPCCADANGNCSIIDGCYCCTYSRAPCRVMILEGADSFSRSHARLLGSLVLGLLPMLHVRPLARLVVVATHEGLLLHRYGKLLASSADQPNCALVNHCGMFCAAWLIDAVGLAPLGHCFACFIHSLIRSNLRYVLCYVVLRSRRSSSTNTNHTQQAPRHRPTRVERMRLLPGRVPVHGTVRPLPALSSVDARGVPLAGADRARRLCVRARRPRGRASVGTQGHRDDAHVRLSCDYPPILDGAGATSTNNSNCNSCSCRFMSGESHSHTDIVTSFKHLTTYTNTTASDDFYNKDYTAMRALLTRWSVIRSFVRSFVR